MVVNGNDKRADRGQHAAQIVGLLILAFSGSLIATDHPIEGFIDLADDGALQAGVCQDAPLLVAYWCFALQMVRTSHVRHCAPGEGSNSRLRILWAASWTSRSAV